MVQEQLVVQEPRANGGHLSKGSGRPGPRASRYHVGLVGAAQPSLAAVQHLSTRLPREQQPCLLGLRTSTGACSVLRSLP